MQITSRIPAGAASAVLPVPVPAPVPCPPSPAPRGDANEGFSPKQQSSLPGADPRCRRRSGITCVTSWEVSAAGSLCRGGQRRPLGDPVKDKRRTSCSCPRGARRRGAAMPAQPWPLRLHAPAAAARSPPSPERLRRGGGLGTVPPPPGTGAKTRPPAVPSKG